LVQSSTNESWIDEDSSKDYLSVPGSERNSKVVSEQDLDHRLGRRSSSSKEKLDVLGHRVKDKFTRISRSFRIHRPRDNPVETGGDLQDPNNPSLSPTSRERSGSLPGGERKGSRAMDGTPSWEIPSSFLPSPIMEATSPDGIPTSPFRATELFDSDDPPMPELANGTGPGSDRYGLDQSDPQSALQDRNWYTNGEMVVFVLILNLGFTALFAHLLS
jgi:hypothetical protein